MTQTSNYVIDNASGASVRSDLNDVLASAVSLNAGTTAPVPSPTGSAPQSYAYMLWADTNTAVKKLKMRNGSNTAWIEIGDLDQNALNIVANKFPNVTSEVTATSAQLNNIVYLPSGTKMIFFQASNPVGWTKDTANNDKALRVVSGTGGGSGGSVSFSTLAHSHTGGSTSLTIAQMPAHTHTFTAQQDIGNFTDDGGGPDERSAASSSTTGSTGSGSGHSHTVGSTSISPKYIDVIVCTKS